MVKDPEDFRKCEMLIKTHFEELKHIFINLIAQSDYPHVGWIDFVNFCDDCGVMDDPPKIETNVVDLAFISTKVNAVDTAGTTKSLFRHEFLEILIRIAGSKFKDNGVTKNFNEALSMLLE